MELDKNIFFSAVDELMQEENLKAKDIFDNTSISKSTWNRMRKNNDPDSMPHITQLLELCELLNTTLYYLLFKRGPRQITPGMLDRMVDIMEAFTDREFTEKRNIIDRVAAINKRDALISIKLMIPAIMQSHAAAAKLRGEEPNDYLKVLERRPTG